MADRSIKLTQPPSLGYFAVLRRNGIFADPCSSTYCFSKLNYDREAHVHTGCWVGRANALCILAWQAGCVRTYLFLPPGARPAAKPALAAFLFVFSGITVAVATSSTSSATVGCRRQCCNPARVRPHRDSFPGDLEFRVAGARGSTLSCRSGFGYCPHSGRLCPGRHAVGFGFGFGFGLRLGLRTGVRVQNGHYFCVNESSCFGRGFGRLCCNFDSGLHANRLCWDGGHAVSSWLNLACGLGLRGGLSSGLTCSLGFRGRLGRRLRRWLLLSGRHFIQSVSNVQTG